MKVSELEGPMLDYWVGKAMGLNCCVESFPTNPPEPRACWLMNGKLLDLEYGPYAPSTNWGQGGPLIEANQIFLDPPHDMHVHGGSRAGWHTEKEWNATVSARVRVYWRPDDDREGFLKRGRVGRGKGATPLIAAMRAIVTSVYGEDVPDGI
jgi:hypothetical protein